ncbi:hypothetical protein AAMO2058_000411700 [Amorphochlora amoebiformis]
MPIPQLSMARVHRKYKRGNSREIKATPRNINEAAQQNTIWSRCPARKSHTNLTLLLKNMCTGRSAKMKPCP